MFLVAAGGKRLARIKGFLNNARIKPLKPGQCRYFYEVY
jgi:hypothetical protein